MPATETLAEARRSMEICNACRYCEGFCAVFPAMERHRSFVDSDLEYLANLCHNCRGCYYACQYAPPHEFGLNVPKVFAELRRETYEEFAWPRAMGAVFERNGALVSLAIAAGIAVALALSFALIPGRSLLAPQRGPGAFYALIPWAVMAGVAILTLGFSVLSLAISGVRFWRATRISAPMSWRALAVAIHDVLTLRNLGGAGHGCNDVDEGFSQVRRRFHHALFYGFVLCFLSTTTAAFDDYFLGLPAPYPLLSAPVLLGIFGGIGLTVGAVGMLWIKAVGDPAPGARKLLGGDYALLLQLILAAVTGLLLLAFRSTAAMGVLLAIHLGVILSFFVTMPYSKFVHGLYRSAALLRSAQERRLPAVAGD